MRRSTLDAPKQYQQPVGRARKSIRTKPFSPNPKSPISHCLPVYGAGLQLLELTRRRAGCPRQVSPCFCSCKLSIFVVVHIERRVVRIKSRVDRWICRVL